MKKIIARISEGSTGRYYITPEELDYLDHTGSGYATKAEALRASHWLGYTHAVGSGCPWSYGMVKRIPVRYRRDW